MYFADRSGMTRAPGSARVKKIAACIRICGWMSKIAFVVSTAIGAIAGTGPNT
jgi:hypothetical protein